MKPSLHLDFLILKATNDTYLADTIVLHIFHRDTLRIK